MVGQVLVLAHWEGALLLRVQEVVHVTVCGLDAVGGDLGGGVGGEGLWVVVTVAPFFLWVWVVWGLFVFSAVVQHCYVIQLMLAFSANPVL